MASRRVITIAIVLMLAALLSGCCPEGPTVRVTPSEVELAAGGTATFAAIVTCLDDTGVTWTASCGSISGTGNTVTYMAPAEAGSCTVTATSVVRSDLRANAIVTVIEADNGTPAPPVTSADAILARCPSAAEVAAIDAALVLTFEDDPTAGEIVCPAAQSSRDLTLLEAQAYRVLIIAQHLTFDAPLPWTPKPLYDWLTAAIDGIRFRHDIEFSFCCNPARTINIQTRNLSALLFPSEFRHVGTLLVLFVHEARHSEGFPHTCGALDNTIAELGAWGVQYHLNVFLGTRSDPQFIDASTRAEFVYNAQRVCDTRFCYDSCP